MTKPSSRPAATLQLDKKTYQELKRQADAAGVSVQDWMQQSLDAHARKLFPTAFPQGDSDG